MHPEVLLGHLANAVLDLAVHAHGVRHRVFRRKVRQRWLEDHLVALAARQLSAQARYDQRVGELGQRPEHGVGGRGNPEKRHERGAARARILVGQIVQRHTAAHQSHHPQQWLIMVHQHSAEARPRFFHDGIHHIVGHTAEHGAPGVFHDDTRAGDFQPQKVGREQNHILALLQHPAGVLDSRDPHQAPQARRRRPPGDTDIECGLSERAEMFFHQALLCACAKLGETLANVHQRDVAARPVQTVERLPQERTAHPQHGQRQHADRAHYADPEPAMPLPRVQQVKRTTPLRRRARGHCRGAS